VTGGQNTVIQSSSGAFGSLSQGGVGSITDSVVLSNTGSGSAKVEARFEDSTGSLFGLISGSNVLPASDFQLGPTGSLVSLKIDGTDVEVATAPVGTTHLNARLSIPSLQPYGSYAGRVILTFSNA
jgi:hypothetical protein